MIYVVGSSSCFGIAGKFGAIRVVELQYTHHAAFVTSSESPYSDLCNPFFAAKIPLVPEDGPHQEDCWGGQG